VPNSSTTNGTQLQIWDCNSNSNQRWTYTTSNKQLTVYGNKCLDASGRGTTNGTAIIIWDCSGQTNQQWNINSNGTITGVQSGLCLDAVGAATGNGTKLQLYSCHGGTNQQWTLPGDGTIRSGGRCLTAPASLGNAVTVATCNNAAAQRWTF